MLHSGTLLPRWSNEQPYETKHVSGSKAKGRAYERAVGRLLRLYTAELGWELKDHQWIETFDGWLQPDFVLIAPSECCLIVECKLTWKDCAGQLRKYKLALEGMKLNSTVIVACRNLTAAAPTPFIDFEDATDQGVWHLFL